jgi:glycosyltransferase involved in cell wall biosynthesis
LIPLVIAKIFSIKSIVIVGGYDAISDKEIDHGIFSKNNLRQKIARMNFNLATNIWVVDETLSKGCKKAFIQNNINSGLINWMPHLEKKIKVVPTGYSSTFWKKTKLKSPKTVLTVANFNDSRVVKLKGIPIILKLAKELPSFQFRILGLKTDSIIPLDSIPSNVELIKSKNSTELIDYFSKNQFYIQASRLEGLPNALCEAMLCECIPIGNAVFGIPKVIGNTGLLFNGEKDFKKIKNFLKGKNKKSGIHARQHIINFFDEEKRIKEFKKI